ncbi:MAG TPA: NAD-dependent epimerase/dehydratase family protein [Gemmatimonadales bacterium]|jgi:nucleoside-diphosphate-sugar epimerase
MARVLVIGGTLFIGRALVELLLERGDEVVIMHRGTSTPFGDRTGAIRCDRNDIAAVQSALKGTSFDLVFDNVYDVQRGTGADAVSAAAVAAATGRLRRYVFTSTVAVFGEGGTFGDGGGFDEDSPLVPPDFPNPYSAQKAESERALFALHQSRGIPVTTVRPAFIYGPHNPVDREAWFWDRIALGRPIIVPDDGSRTMQFVLAQDVARGAMRAGDADKAIGRAHHLVNYPPITQRNFVLALGKAAGREPTIVPIPRDVITRHGGKLAAPPCYFGVYLDLPPIPVRSERTRRDLGLEFTPFEQGLRETFRWYQQQQRPTPDFAWEDKVLRER